MFIYASTCSLVFIAICLRGFFVPFTHDEASTFFFYIQSNNYLPYKAHVYTNNHVLNSALANLFYHLAGSSRFVLRLPNILAFPLLCFGIFRLFNYLNKTGSKIILLCFFILTFNFLDFFELCRGYGLSMAFMVLGLSYLFDYFNSQGFKNLLLFSLYWQLALSANLIFVVLLSVLLFFIFLFQFRQRVFWSTRNLTLQAINLALLFFWIKFSFFYRSQGVLDSGFGEDYWEVSFKSLMLFIFGTDFLWMQIVVVSVFLTVLIGSSILYIRKPASLDAIYKPQFFLLLLLCCFIVLFYLTKKLLNVNYPEDRTGLFFYVLFALSIAFFLDQIRTRWSLLFAAPVLLSSLVYFALAFNLTSFTHYFYHVMPKQVYSYLENEFHKDKHVFTLGGHTNREMNYAFANYRGGGMLNPMDIGKGMCMNCDYYYALKEEKPYYQFFYDEVVTDKRWGRVLLKRKQKIERKEIKSLSTPSIHFAGNSEYFEFLRFTDSATACRNCMEADLELHFKKVPKPFKAFVVFSINDEKDQPVYYKRLLLNWIADDLDGAIKRFKLTTGPLPQKFKAIVYLWNIDKKEAEFTLADLKLFELHAPGINVTIPPGYIHYMELLTQQHLL